eukprot:9386-Rhodomonas_salina.3
MTRGERGGAGHRGRAAARESAYHRRGGRRRGVGEWARGQEEAGAKLRGNAGALTERGSEIESNDKPRGDAGALQAEGCRRPGPGSVRLLYLVSSRMARNQLEPERCAGLRLRFSVAPIKRLNA